MVIVVALRQGPVPVPENGSWPSAQGGVGNFRSFVS